MSTYQKLVIIGAPRSGTNMLRDTLCRIPCYASWPCDEINYIWRYGNARSDTDYLLPSAARPETVDYVRKQFDRMAERSGCSVLVEKTCANSLRIGFVDAIVPDARYIFIYRNGIDAALSAAKRWRAPLDLKYILAKARFVPRRDLLFYATRYLMNRTRKLISRDRSLRTWGPAIDGVRVGDGDQSTEKIAALQWQACIERSLEDLSRIDPSRVCRVRYEEFVADPSSELASIIRFVGQGPDRPSPDLVRNISTRFIGSGRLNADSATVETLGSLLRPTLHRLGYE